jgi:hypothetical protein
MYSMGTGIGNTGIGYEAGYNNTSGNYNIFLGYNAGDTSTATVGQHCVIGSVVGYISDVYLGSGEATASFHSNVTVHATGGAGSNSGGASLTFAGGISTGNIAGGNIIFQVAAAGTSGSTANTLTTILTINSNLYAAFSALVTTPISTKTGAYTMLATDSTILADTSSSAFQITLMAGPPTGATVNVKMIGSGANNLTIAPSAGTIDGNSTIVVSTVNVNYTMQYDGAEWRVL